MIPTLHPDECHVKVDDEEQYVVSNGGLYAVEVDPCDGRIYHRTLVLNEDAIIAVGPLLVERFPQIADAVRAKYLGYLSGEAYDQQPNPYQLMLMLDAAVVVER